MGTVYEMSSKGMAQYIADLTFLAKYQSTRSVKGERINQEGSRYAIKIDSLRLKKMSPKLTVFLSTEDTIHIDIYSGEFEFSVISKELSGGFPKDVRPAFCYKADACTKRITISPPEDGIYTIESFDQVVCAITNAYEKMLGSQIALARPEDEWFITPLQSAAHQFQVEYYTV